MVTQQVSDITSEALILHFSKLSEMILFRRSEESRYVFKLVSLIERIVLLFH